MKYEPKMEKALVCRIEYGLDIFWRKRKSGIVMRIALGGDDAL